MHWRRRARGTLRKSAALSRSLRLFFLGRVDSMQRDVWRWTRRWNKVNAILSTIAMILTSSICRARQRHIARRAEYGGLECEGCTIEAER